jgi:WD40 repeat protein
MHSLIFTFLHFNSGCKNGKLRLFYCDWPKREYDYVNNETMNTEIHHLQKSSSQSSLSLSKDQDRNNMLQTKLKANLIETFSSKSTIYGHFSSIHCLDSFDYRKESLVVTCCSDLIIRVFNIESGQIDVFIITN